MLQCYSCLKQTAIAPLLSNAQTTEGGHRALGQPCCFLFMLGSALAGPRHRPTIFREAPRVPAESDGLRRSSWCAFDLGQSERAGGYPGIRGRGDFALSLAWRSAQPLDGPCLVPKTLPGPQSISKPSHLEDARDQNYSKWETEEDECREGQRNCKALRFLLGQLSSYSLSSNGLRPFQHVPHSYPVPHLTTFSLSV